MKPKKLKELLVFAVTHKEPDLIPNGKHQVLEDALMKLSATELEILEEYMGGLHESTKITGRKRSSTDDNTEDDLEEKSA